MTIEQLNIMRIKIDELIQDAATDPQTTNHAYDRCMEKVLSRLQESRMWTRQTINILESEQSEKSNQ